MTLQVLGHDLRLGSAGRGSASPYRAEPYGATRLTQLPGGLVLDLLLLALLVLDLLLPQERLPHPLGLCDRVAGDLHGQKTDSVSEGC